jgi:quinol monooxygenase YgiN
MKAILLTALLSCTSLAGKTQNKINMETQQQDSLAIFRALEGSYFKGIYTGDIALLSTIYYPGALLFGDVKAQPYAKDLTQYLDGVKNRQSPRDSGKPFKGEMLSIKVVNSIAIAEVRVTMYDFVYLEFLSFHKIDGKWLVVNKMISDVVGSPVGEAAVGAPAAQGEARLVAYMEIIPAFEKEIKGALALMAVESNKEADCLEFAVNTRKDLPLSIIIYEAYKSEAAFQLHKASVHAKRFFNITKGKLVDDKIDVVFLIGLNSSK